MIKMRKAPKVFVSFLLVLIFVIVSVPEGQSQNIIHVPGDYNSIQEALNHAQDIDTVEIETGEYIQSLFIAKHAFLKGIGVIISGDSIIVSSGKNLFFKGNFTINSVIDLKNGNLGPGTFYKKGNLTLNDSVITNKFLPMGKMINISVPYNMKTAEMYMGMDLYYYDENSLQYMEINSPDFPLIPGVGYIVYHNNPIDTLHEITGKPNLENVQNNLICSGYIQNGHGWNLLGNPYTCYINWDLMEKPEGMGHAIYYYEPESDKYLFNVNGIGNTTPFIPSMKGFFVHYDDIQSSPEIAFSQDLCVIPDYEDYQHNNKEKVLGLKVTGNGLSDETFIQFNDFSTKGYDLTYDALKINPEPYNSLVLYTENGYNSLPFSVNALPERDLVNLHFNASISGSYIIETMEVSDFPEVILEDLVTGKKTDLLTSYYTFDFNEGDEPNRFVVHFKPTGYIYPPSPVNVYGYQDYIYIVIPDDNNSYSGSIRDIFGEEILSNREFPIGFNVFEAIPNNYYFVKIITNNSSEQTFTVYTYESQSYKSDNPFIAFPNPFNEELTILNSGLSFINYKLRILDIYGHEVKRLENVKVGDQIELSSLKPGVYFFVISEINSKRTEVIKVVKN